MKNPRVSPAPFPERPGDSQGKERQGQTVWQSHPTTSGAGDPANSSYLQQRVQPAAGQWELGRWEGRAQGERRDTVTARGELLSLYMQKQAGTVQASPAERHQRLLCLLPTPQHPPRLFHPGAFIQDGL